MIERLQWDSDFFGIGIANLTVEGFDPSCLEKIPADIDMIQCRCEIADVKTINSLEERGFRFADIRMTYVIDLEKADFVKREATLATEEDIVCLREIARTAFDDSRYHSARIDHRRVGDFYATWLENAVRGEFDDACLKAMVGELPAGFITVKLAGNIAKIGIVGVSENHRGQGLGQKLLECLADYCRNRGVRTVYVATQGKNVRAQRFYIKNGFTIKSIAAWYYLKRQLPLAP